MKYRGYGSYPCTNDRVSLRARRGVGSARQNAGITTLLVVAFMGIFTLIVGGLSGYALQQSKYGRALLAREEALSIAESGLEYFKWHVAHNTEIREDGTGLQSSYTYTVEDPEGGEMGAAVLTTDANMQCGRVQWIDVESEGISNADQSKTRTIAARYMRPSVGEYALVTDTGVHYTSAVTGPIHSNSAVRMDGSNNSTVTSKLDQDEFWCTSSYGCTPSRWEDGVFGTGPNTELWRFPASEISFATILQDTLALRTYATNDGLYLSPTRVYLDGVAQGSSFASVGGSESTGFHIVFNPDGTVNIYRVTSTYSISNTYAPPGVLGSDWTPITDRPDISARTLVVSNVSLPSDCSLIYSEAKTWISGTVMGKITVVAADPGSFDPDIMLGGTITVSDGNIGYATTDGTTGLTAIAERGIRYAYRVPNDMSVRGIFVAQNGFYGRYYYAYVGGANTYNIRNSITLNGSIVSKLRASVWYGDSGFQNRFTTYDRLQAFQPSPFTPSARVDYGYALWNEE